MSTAPKLSRTVQQKLDRLAASGLAIYVLLDNRPDLFFTIEELEQALAAKLIGWKLGILPNRTRSKVFKTKVCEVLGYPVPKSFQKTQPRFPGQDFDTYVQKENNLQVWNEDVAPTRRYVLARPDDDGIIRAVKVYTGDAIAKLDKTGTLTSKFQAYRKAGHTGSQLISHTDTATFVREFAPADSLTASTLGSTSPTDVPVRGKVLSTRAIYNTLSELIGTTIEDPGEDQERNRGAGLQRAVCEALKLRDYADNGQWPDILSQALELKLQMARTVDLGLVSPDGTEPAQEVGTAIRHCDVRYAVFYAEKQKGSKVKLTELVVSTGADFFLEFEKMAGNVTNRKLQIPLPRNFFE
jgi:hypothetical protein